MWCVICGRKIFRSGTKRCDPCRGKWKRERSTKRSRIPPVAAVPSGERTVVSEPFVESDQWVELGDTSLPGIYVRKGTNVTLHKMITTPWHVDSEVKTYMGIPLLISEDVVPANYIVMLKFVVSEGLCDDCDEVVSGRFVVSTQAGTGYVEWCEDCYNFQVEELNGSN